MFDQIKAIEISQKSLITSIFINLGLNNISSISNCMSRIRVVVKDTSLLADDSEFLKHNAKGVIRDGNSIHLIYGQKSIVITKQLKQLLDIINDQAMLDLVSSFHGIKYISRITHNNDNITIYFHPAPHIQEISTSKLKTKYGLICKLDNNCINIVGSVELLQRIQYTILYWELIQSIFVFDKLDIDNIREVTHNSYDLHISLSNCVDFVGDEWIQMGLEIEINSIDSKDLIIGNCSDEFFAVFLEHYDFLKK